MKKKKEKLVLNFTRKKFNTYEKYMYDNLFDALNAAEKEYIEHGKGDKHAYMAIFLMNHGIFAPPIFPEDYCYITASDKVQRGIVKQVDTTVTINKVGSTIFYETEDGDDRFFHGTELGKRVFKNRHLAVKKLRKEKKDD